MRRTPEKSYRVHSRVGSAVHWVGSAVHSFLAVHVYLLWLFRDVTENALGSLFCFINPLFHFKYLSSEYQSYDTQKQ